MPTIRGLHCQAGTERQVAYWASFDHVNGQSVFVVAVFEDAQGRYLGKSDEVIACDSGPVPEELRVRSALMTRIDRTVFGEARLPDARWIGWRPGPYL